MSHGGGQAAGAMRQVRATGLGNVATSVALTGDVLREGRAGSKVNGIEEVETAGQGHF